MIRRSKGDDPFEGFSQVEEIGRGSFATVYRAVDTYSGQPVALKLLSVASGRRFDHTMFELEARALGAVSAHPNIVTLHRAMVRANGQPLLVLELCDGSLYDRLARQGPLPAREAVAVGIKLAGALETAHQAGILHRDLKPHNVLITRYGEPALADFGVAELRDTMSGGSPLSGLTLLHAAPEVILGQPATPASDVYGLVSTVYELVRGHAPFFVTPDEDPAVLQRRVLHEPVPRLEAPELPPALRGIVEHALAKSPSDRPVSARELAQLLRDLEHANGWGPTPCRIDGVDELRPSEARGAPLPSLGRAAATTGIPSLGLGAQPFTGRPVEAPELDPAPARARELLPTDPRAPVGPGDSAPSDPGDSAPSDPGDSAPSDPVEPAEAQPAEPSAPLQPGADAPSALTRSAPMPENRPTTARPPMPESRPPTTAPPPAPRPPTTAAPRHGTPPVPDAPVPTSPPPPPAPSRDTSWPPPPVPHTPAENPGSEAESATGRPLWGYATGGGLHETIGLTDPNQLPAAEKEPDAGDSGKRRRRRRRRG